ncbi:MAG TPA: hypothetical protein VM686_28690 [Polyangiaceae bacterium]|nr:hypothetical protein [Polyangiaceae bacterium]
MRTITPAAREALNGAVVGMVLLVEMYLTQTLRLTSASMPLSWGGNDYLGVGTLGGVEEVEDSPGEYKNLVFTLSGVAIDMLSLAMQENIRGKRVVVRMATLDAATLAVLDAPIIWTGTLDQMPVNIGTETATVNVTAEHRGVTFGRPKPLNYTDEDQRRLYPGDTSLRFIQSQSTHEDVWPAASYFRK